MELTSDIISMTWHFHMLFSTVAVCIAVVCCY